MNVRAELRSSGSAQTDGTTGPAQTNRIGPRPDLLALNALLPVAKDENKEN
jgi:hypothetical protein